MNHLDVPLLPFRHEATMPTYRLATTLPITLDCPEPMRAAVQYVLDGEYESHHDGAGLDILDIGANVGAFSLWAERRWPGSRIRAFEPNPGTFALLERNTSGHPLVTATNAALFPGGLSKATFFSRFAGDGEAGLSAYAGDTFNADATGSTFEVDVVDPASLASADIVKIDIEGGEAQVLAHLDLSRTALVLAEFQNRKNRIAMQATLTAAGFEPLLDEACPWDPILDYRDYRQDLKGDVFGRMFWRRIGQTKLVHQVPDVPVGAS